MRAVGTNTLRVAKNAAQFIADAEAALGFPIEVIFGREEARLVYLGVSHSLPPAPHRRLVVDIGGGSTEFVIGTGYEPELMESLRVGCVSHSLRFFGDGRIDKQAMKKAELAASNEIERIVKEYRRTGWKQAVGSSGTAKSLAAILAANGWAKGTITADGLDRLRSQVIKAGDVGRSSICPGCATIARRSCPAGSRSCSPSSTAWAWRRWKWRRARCGRACSTTCSGACSTTTCAR